MILISVGVVIIQGNLENISVLIVGLICVALGVIVSALKYLKR